MRRLLLAGALLTATALAGCGDTEESSTPSETAGDGDAAEVVDVVEVVAEDVTFPDSSYEATAGTVTVRYTNEGAIPHTLVIEDVDGFKLEVAANGDEAEGTADLEAGSYVLYCDVPGHREAGMEATLAVS